MLLVYPALLLHSIGIGYPAIFVGNNRIDDTRELVALSLEAIVNPLLAITEDLVITVSVFVSPSVIVIYLLGALISNSLANENCT